jgi:hypothetical protein
VAQTTTRVLLGLVALATSFGAVSVAFAAKTQQIKDSSRLHLVAGKGNALTESGTASGDLPGTVRISLTLRFSTRTAHASFTFYTKNGMLTGHASGRLKIGKGPYDSFAGSIQIHGGSNQFHGAHGNGEMYGAINRDTYAMSVQVTGTLHY